MGTVRVACSSGPTVALPLATITSGRNATNSATYLRMRSASPADHRVSILHIATVGPAELLQSLQECRVAGLTVRVIYGRGMEHADASHPLALLRPRRERPCRRRAAEQRDELTPSHSITSSASCCSCNGTSRPS